MASEEVGEPEPITATERDDWLLEPWTPRPWVSAALLGLAGFVIYLFDTGPDLTPWRAAATAFVAFASLTLAVTFAPDREKSSLIFSALAGLVIAGIAWRVASAGERYAASEFWFAAGLLAVGLALPLFQAGFHRLRWRTSYKTAHFHVWTDAISVAGAAAFTLLSWALIWLLAALFELIQISLLRELVAEDWFGLTFAGTAFGTALGTLRNQLRILGTLQSVVMLVFSLLAVPLAVALAIFLIAVIFSGLDVLWEATRSATPVLLAISVGCFVLVNAVVRDERADMSGSRIMRIAARILALGILPLTIFAAVSMGTRIAQHGLSPERIWSLIAIAVGVAYGVGYFVAVLRGWRGEWDERLRRANMHLAVVTCVIAFVLALPIVDFGAISARNQIARLNSGAVSAEDFDYAALRWDFGDAGRRALQRLSERGGGIGEQAQAMLEREERFPVTLGGRYAGTTEISYDFADPELRKWVAAHIGEQPWLCEGSCVALDLGTSGERRRVALVTRNGVEQVSFRADGVPDPPPAPEVAPPREGALTAEDVELREFTGRRVYVDGKPVGAPFE